MAISTAGIGSLMNLVGFTLLLLPSFVTHVRERVGIIDASPLSMPSAVPTAWLGFPVCTYIVEDPTFDDKGYQYGWDWNARRSCIVYAGPVKQTRTATWSKTRRSKTPSTTVSTTMFTTPPAIYTSSYKSTTSSSKSTSSSSSSKSTSSSSSYKPTATSSKYTSYISSSVKTSSTSTSKSTASSAKYTSYISSSKTTSSTAGSSKSTSTTSSTKSSTTTTVVRYFLRLHG